MTQSDDVQTWLGSSKTSGNPNASNEFGMFPNQDFSRRVVNTEPQPHVTEEEYVAMAMYALDPLRDPEPLSWDEAQKYQSATRRYRRLAATAISAINEYRKQLPSRQDTP